MLVAKPLSRLAGEGRLPLHLRGLMAAREDASRDRCRAPFATHATEVRENMMCSDGIVIARAIGRRKTPSFDGLWRRGDPETRFRPFIAGSLPPGLRSGGRDDDSGSTQLRHALGVLRALAVACALLSSAAARADALDDTLAKFLADKFPQTEAAVSELAAEAPPQAAAILDALGDNRLLIDPADHLVAYKTDRRRDPQRQDRRADSRRRRRRVQEGPRQQCAQKRHPGRDGISHARQSRSREAP